MGTQGAFGWRAGGVSKYGRVTLDSYPEELGRRVLAGARTATLSQQETALARITPVDASTPPTPEQWARLAAHRSPLGPCYPNPWDDLLWRVRGDPGAYVFGGVRELPDGRAFLGNPACLWVYTLDLAAGGLEVAARGEGGLRVLGRWSFAALRGLSAGEVEDLIAWLTAAGTRAGPAWSAGAESPAHALHATGLHVS